MATNGNLALTPRIITIDAAERSGTTKLRVAAYARVSSSSEDQLNSFAAQNTYYYNLITSTPNWDMVDLYADEGITGTSAAKRADFQRLLSDCRRGKIDRILVKSISRFARNTKECLETVRELKLLGISVCFEKEGIDTARMTGEMMTAVFASLAQEESRSISRNMRQGYQLRMQNRTYIPSNLPYGFVRVNGAIQIHPDQAIVVQRVFREYLAGVSADEIARQLSEETVKTKNGNTAWNPSCICRMISNEKYMGDSLWQKYISTDTLPYQSKLNRGEKEAFYVFNTHEGIVSAEVFRAANDILEKRRAKIVLPDQEISAFQKKVVCGICGSGFRKKTVRKNTYWACIGREKKRNSVCEVTQIPDWQFQSSFLRLYYNLKHHGIAILNQLLTNLRTIRTRRMLWSLDVIALNKRISDLLSQNQMLATLNKQGLIDPDIFIIQTNELTEQLRAAKLEKEKLLSADGDTRMGQTEELIAMLEEGPDFLDTFDPELFGELVDQIIVDSNTSLRFRLKNGLELTETIERTVR